MGKRVRRISLLSLLAVTASLPSTVQAQTIPPNVRLNTDMSPFLQNEEQVWINLTDSLNVIADWRDWRLGYRRVGVGRSTDGGATWTDQLVDPMVFDRQSDPVLVGDRGGRFFMNMLDYDNSTPIGGGNSHIVVYTSTNATTWTSRGTITGKSLFGAATDGWITVPFRYPPPEKSGE